MCQRCKKHFCICDRHQLNNISLFKNLLKPEQIEYYSSMNIDQIKNAQILSGDHKILLEKESFFLEYDKKAHMMNLIFPNLLMLDWDEKYNITKDTAIKILKLFIKKGEIKNIKLKDLCFKIYESDNGIHAFLVSHKLHHTNDISIFLKLSLCTDIYYNLFTYKNGTNIRLTPKIMSNGNLKSEKEMERQFIQKEGIIFQGENIIYIGNTKKIDPRLEELTNMIYNTQLFVMKEKNLYSKLINDDEKLLEKIVKELS